MSLPNPQGRAITAQPVPPNESQLGRRAAGTFLGVFGAVINIAFVALLLLANQRSEYSGHVGFEVTMLLLGVAGLLCALLMVKAPRRGSMFLIAFAVAGFLASFVSGLFGVYPVVPFLGSLMQAVGGNLGLMSVNPPPDSE